MYNPGNLHSDNVYNNRLNKKAFQCRTCDKMFNHKSEVTRHYLTHSSVRLFPCNMCKCAYKEKSKLKRHMYQSHQPGLDEEAINIWLLELTKKWMLDAEDQVKEVWVVDHSCPLCGLRFSSEGDLIQHMKNHEDYKGEPVDIPIKRPLLVPVEDTKEFRRLYMCTECQKVCSYKCDIYRHMSCHSEVRPYVCEVCGTTYKEKRRLRHHVREVHHKEPDEKQLRALELILKQEAEHKIKIIHVKNHKCWECGTNFKSENELLTHLPVHGINNVDNREQTVLTEYQDVEFSSHFLNPHLANGSFIEYDSPPVVQYDSPADLNNVDMDSSSHHSDEGETSSNIHKTPQENDATVDDPSGDTEVTSHHPSQNDETLHPTDNNDSLDSETANFIDNELVPLCEPEETEDEFILGI